VIVWLLRHGIAEDHAPGGDDGERALTAEGIARLERAGPAWRRAMGSVDLVFASPLRRAQETAEMLILALGSEVAVETLAELAPGERPLEVLARLQHELQTGRAAVACVGHEPHLGSLLGLLLTGSKGTALPLKKGMLVGVEVESSASMLGRLVVALTQKYAALL
jgi:phosphohistidine phosphatase